MTQGTFSRQTKQMYMILMSKEVATKIFEFTTLWSGVLVLFLKGRLYSEYISILTGRSHRQKCIVRIFTEALAKIAKFMTSWSNFWYSGEVVLWICFISLKFFSTKLGNTGKRSRWLWWSKNHLLQNWPSLASLLLSI